MRLESRLESSHESTPLLSCPSCAPCTMHGDQVRNRFWRSFKYWLPIPQRVIFKIALLTFKTLQTRKPSFLQIPPKHIRTVYLNHSLKCCPLQKNCINATVSSNFDRVILWPNKFQSGMKQWGHIFLSIQLTRVFKSCRQISTTSFDSHQQKSLYVICADDLVFAFPFFLDEFRFR